MYEVELKIELTADERRDLVEEFKKRDFSSKGITPQNDFYVEAHESPYGGYDLQRYRDEAGTFIFTKKMWEMVDGTPARREDEREVSEEEMRTKIAQAPRAINIKKDRECFEGKYQGSDIKVMIDAVKFDHSPNVRYFVEAEMVVKDQKDVKEAKQRIRDFLQEVLGRKDPLIESPGMFTMAYNKK